MTGLESFEKMVGLRKKAYISKIPFRDGQVQRAVSIYFGDN